MIGFCSVHCEYLYNRKGSFHVLEFVTDGEMPMPEKVIPTLTASQLMGAVETPCGQECFLMGNTSTIASIGRAFRVSGFTYFFSGNVLEPR